MRSIRARCRFFPTPQAASLGGYRLDDVFTDLLRDVQDRATIPSLANRSALHRAAHGAAVLDQSERILGGEAVRWVVALRADPRLPAWSVRVIDELDIIDRRANDLALRLSPEQLKWKPAEDLWSVGQCLEHFYAAIEVYLPAIANALDDRPPSPVQDITPGWFGRWFIRTHIEPSSRGKRARALSRIAPAQHIDPSLLDLFLRSNDVARDLVRRAGAYNINRIRFGNPFIPLLRFTVGTGLEIVWRHHRRHLLQAERVKQTLTFPQVDRAITTTPWD